MNKAYKHQDKTEGISIFKEPICTISLSDSPPASAL